MMRVTIIPVDGFVSVDGVSFGGLDLSFMDVSVHAVQWYDTHGEIEIKDLVTRRMVANEVITSIDIYQPAIDAWQVAKTTEELAEAIAAAAAAEATVAAADNPPQGETP
jgi:hypothetical protein